jgi:hypothetical protein
MTAVLAQLMCIAYFAVAVVLGVLGGGLLLDPRSLLLYRAADARQHNATVVRITPVADSNPLTEGVIDAWVCDAEIGGIAESAPSERGAIKLIDRVTSRCPSATQSPRTIYICFELLNRFADLSESVFFAALISLAVLLFLLILAVATIVLCRARERQQNHGRIKWIALMSTLVASPMLAVWTLPQSVAAYRQVIAILHEPIVRCAAAADGGYRMFDNDLTLTQQGFRFLPLFGVFDLEVVFAIMLYVSALGALPSVLGFFFVTAHCVYECARNNMCQAAQQQEGGREPDAAELGARPAAHGEPAQHPQRQWHQNNPLGLVFVAVHDDEDGDAEEQGDDADDDEEIADRT